MRLVHGLVRQHGLADDVANGEDVLHAFQKKTQATSKADIALAARRYRDLMKGR